MKIVVLRFVLHLLIAFRVNRLTRSLGRQGIVILCYHGFREDGSTSDGESHEGRHLARSRFRKQLEYLTGQGRVISLQDAMDALATGSDIKPGTTVITVDDGYESFARIGAPELIETGAQATLFVSTGMVDRKANFWVDRLEYALDFADVDAIILRIGGSAETLSLATDVDRANTTNWLRDLAKRSNDDVRQRLISDVESATGIALSSVESLPDHLEILTWDDIREVSTSELISIGSHTVTHPIVTSCSDEVVEREVAESRQRIAEELGGDCGIFCYPNGGASDFDSRTKSAVLKAGYVGALTTVGGINNGGTDRFELHRHMIDDRASWPEFVARVDGLFDVLTLLWSRWARLTNGLNLRTNNSLTVLKDEEK